MYLQTKGDIEAIANKWFKNGSNNSHEGGDNYKKGLHQGTSNGDNVYRQI